MFHTHRMRRPPKRWQLVYCLLSSLCYTAVPWGISYKWNGIWQGLYDVGGGGCVLGVTYFLRRQGLLVCRSTLCAPSTWFPAPSSVSCVSPPLEPACMPDRQTDAICRCISSSGPLSLPTNSPLLAHRLQISSASLPLDKGQYQWQNIFYVWNVARNKQSSIRFV